MSVSASCTGIVGCSTVAQDALQVLAGSTGASLLVILGLLWLSISLTYGLSSKDHDTAEMRTHAGRSGVVWMFFGFIGGWLAMMARRGTLDHSGFLMADLLLTGLLALIVLRSYLFGRHGGKSALRRLAPGLLCFQASLMLTAAICGQILDGTTFLAGMLGSYIAFASEHWFFGLIVPAIGLGLLAQATGIIRELEPEWVLFLSDDVIEEAERKYADAKEQERARESAMWSDLRKKAIERRLADEKREERQRAEEREARERAEQRHWEENQKRRERTGEWV